MPNASWICFTCRNAVRRNPYKTALVTCSTCSKPMICLGAKIPVPPKNNLKEWAALETQLRLLKQQQTQSLRLKTLQTKRDLKSQIESLEKRPATPGRSRHLRQLRKQIQDATNPLAS